MYGKEGRHHRAGSLLALAALLILNGTSSATAIEPGWVVGRVVSTKGKAIAAATVRATPAGEGAVVEASTSAKGTFRIELAPGEYRLEFEATGFASSALRERVTVASGKTTKVKYRVELPAASVGSTIRGSVFTADGRSVPGIKVVLERLAADGRSVIADETRSTRTDAMGIYAFHVADGEANYRVSTNSDDYQDSTTTVAAGGGVLVNVPALKIKPRKD